MQGSHFFAVNVEGQAVAFAFGAQIHFLTEPFPARGNDVEVVLPVFIGLNQADCPHAASWLDHELVPARFAVATDQPQPAMPLEGRAAARGNIHISGSQIFVINGKDAGVDFLLKAVNAVNRPGFVAHGHKILFIH